MDCGAGWLPFIKVEEAQPYAMGMAIGKHSASMIQKRIEADTHLLKELLPFAATSEGQHLVQALSTTNRSKYPRYWEELVGIADGSGVPFLELLLLNLRKEISPFLPSKSMEVQAQAAAAEECSDILVLRPDLSLIAHNEDASLSVQHHTFLLQARFSNGIAFVAYAYAGELPTCAFGFNNCGVAFTLNAVPLHPEEVVAGGIGRNFVSRDLLESRDVWDALQRSQIPGLSTGHSYNLMDINLKKILNIETASKGRYSLVEINHLPYFHANTYQHLEVCQVFNQTSFHRQQRASLMSMFSQDDIISILGDVADQEYPIYMSGPVLYTLCTVIFDMEARKMIIYKGNPKMPDECFVFPLHL